MIDAHSRAWWRATLALCLGSFLVFLNLYVVQPLLPSLHQAHGVSTLVANLAMSLATLSLAAARRMQARGRGGIINVSSLAAVTTMGQYAASKVSTLVFTEALAGELRDSPVTVTAVLPGFIRTEFHSRLGVERPGPGLIWLSVDQVVRESLRDARAGKVVSVPGWGYRLAALVAPVVPRPLMRWGSTGFSFARTRGM